MAEDRRRIVFYGNCQAGALAYVFASHPVVAERFHVRHLPSFDDPLNRVRTLEPDEIQATAILFEQFDPVRFPYLSELPSDCRSTTFPSIDFNLLWPLVRDNPYNDRSNPDKPWGEFPYGDRMIIETIDQGLSADEVVDRYLSTSADALPDLERFTSLERGRILARDAKCAVKIADFVFSRFRESFLFWCVNHPTVEALLEIGRRLMASVGGEGSPLAGIDIDDWGQANPLSEPLALINVPVHPKIAAHFELQWFQGMDGRYGLAGANLTYEAYIRRMAASGVATRERLLAGGGMAQDVTV